MDKITQMLENVVRCKYFAAGVHIKHPIENSYQDGLVRTTQTLDHVVMVHILIWDKRKSHINEYSDISTNGDDRGGAWDCEGDLELAMPNKGVKNRIFLFI